MLGLEGLQAQVGAFAFRERDSPSPSWWNALNAAGQPMEGFFVVQRAAKLYPSGALKKTRQLAFLGPFAPRQDDGQHAQLLVRGVDPPLEGQAHFLIVPGA